ncbi:radical SAM protein [Desulfosporosinus sp.]|uniref:radical SAM protein n=1 Tax=Desulfosporosinus sp. TaxID=157907 RepID=UPI000E994AD4|nr:radical SAM protein [Desulfosporosinus sp.]MBC2728464.1 radical SAM protein [Desulfosporosinus sp.]HBV85177.1 radical SAM protein [Desulfosporosinus sp.]
MKDVVELVFRPTPSIERLYLELTNRCNLSCEMCYRQKWQEPLGDMSTGILKAIASEVEVFPDLQEVILGGIGEPTIANNFRRAVELFASRYKVSVTTNGTTLDSELINFLIKSKIAKIILSVDSTDVQTFAAIRHENIQGILESTRLITEQSGNGGPEVIWEFVVMKSTLPYLVETVRQAAKLGVTRVFVSHLLPMREEMMAETLYYPTKSAEMDKVFQAAFIAGLAKGVEVVLPKSELKTDRYCKFVETQSAVVRWDGQVTSCYRFLHSYPEYVFGRYKQIDSHSFGSIEKQSLLGIWTTPEFMRYRYHVLHGEYASCTDCNWVDGCDMVLRADMDCLGHAPSCGDCLWGRGITVCP